MAIDQGEFSAAMAAYLAANDHTIALRRGLAASLPSGLLQGELYYATDTKRLYVGHGNGTAKMVPNADDISGFAAAAQAAWSAPTFQNSWVNFGAPFSNAGYYKDTTGVVHLRGVVKSGTINQTIFDLPAGSRPAAEMMFAVPSNNALAVLHIEATGRLFAATGDNAWVSLDGVTFRV